MSSNKNFTKDNLDQYLKALAKEYRKLSGKKVPAEIVLIGGASVLINYGFRDMTYDMDAIIQAGSAMKDAINHIEDEYGLPHGWLNDDFQRTNSFTPKLLQYSKYYRTYSNIVSIRTVTAEYLLAMKLMSGRQYKFDQSDIVGILMEHKKAGTPLTFSQIKKATEDLYGSYEVLPDLSKKFIESIIGIDDLESLYDTTRQSEKETKILLTDFQQKYPGVSNQDNINDIIATLRAKQGK